MTNDSANLTPAAMRLHAAAPDLARALAEIATVTGFCFNPGPRDVETAERARAALAAAGITDPAAWLKGQG